MPILIYNFKDTTHEIVNSDNGQTMPDLFYDFRDTTHKIIRSGGRQTISGLIYNFRDTTLKIIMRTSNKQTEFNLTFVNSDPTPVIPIKTVFWKTRDFLFSAVLHEQEYLFD